MWKYGTIEHCWQNCEKWSLWITIWWFLRLLYIELSYDPIILFLATYTKELKAGTQVGISISMFIAELLSRTKRWKQSKYPLTNERKTKCS